MKAVPGAWAITDPVEPVMQIVQRRVNTLSHPGSKIKTTIENNIRNRETIGDNVIAAGNQPIQPFQACLGDTLKARGSFRFTWQPVSEHIEPFGEAEPVIDILGDVKFHAALPLMSFSAFLGCFTNQWWG
jgi:hypothetical protein